MSEGYAIGHIDEMGEGPGIRKVRRALDVTEFGVNVLVLRPRHEFEPHDHERQQELYFVHSGALEVRFADGSAHRLEPGAVARVDAGTARQLVNAVDHETVVVAVGGAGGYVGRDGVAIDQLG